MKRALIIGAEGQDGRLLGEPLRSRAYVLAEIGTDRTCLDGVAVSAVDVLNPGHIAEFIRALHADELYYPARTSSTLGRTGREQHGSPASKASTGG